MFKKPKGTELSGLNLVQLAYTLGRMQGILSVFGPDSPELQWLKSRGISDEVIANMRLSVDCIIDAFNGRRPMPETTEHGTPEVAADWAHIMEAAFTSKHQRKTSV